MASVHLGRVTASTGFSRLVAIKRLHREYVADAKFVKMLGEEARLAAHIRHANVIDTLDLAVIDGAMSLVLEYVEGESLATLVRCAEQAGEPIPIPIAVTILCGALRGLEAAHEARRDDGQPLAIVHRDVSPQNVLVGIDGSARVIDFGVAKALDGLELTRPGEVRGKIAYMPPEQLSGRPVTRQVDVYAAGVVLWELLAGKRLFQRDDFAATTAAVLRGATEPPSASNPFVPPELDAIVMRAIARDVSERYLTAREFAAELEPWRTASEDEVGAWVSRHAAERLAATRRLLLQEPSARESPESMSSQPVVVDRTVVLPVSARPPPPSRRSPLFLVAGVLGTCLLAICVVVATRARHVDPMPTTMPTVPEPTSTSPTVSAAATTETTPAEEPTAATEEPPTAPPSSPVPAGSVHRSAPARTVRTPSAPPRASFDPRSYR